MLQPYEPGRTEPVWAMDRYETPLGMSPQRSAATGCPKVSMSRAPAGMLCTASSVAV